MQYLSKKLHNFTTNTLKAYLSIQPSSGCFYDQQDSLCCPKASQKTTVCGNEKSAIFSLVQITLFNNNNSKKKGSSIHCNFSMKLMLTTAWSSITTQHLRSFKITVDKQHCPTAVRCVGGHFLILYTCTHAVSSPQPQSLVWNSYTCEIMH